MRINFDLLDLRSFLAVYELSNFNKAAEFLNLSQPALSRRVRGLEDRLGTALFERSTRVVTPTAAGRQLAPIAQRLLNELDASVDIIGDRQRGHVTIAAIPTAAHYFLPKIIKQFSRKFPLIRLSVLDRPPQEVLDCVVRGEVEFGINMIGAIETDVTFTPLMDDPYVLTCHRDHPLAKKKVLTWHDLTGHALIRIGRANSGNRALLDSALAKAEVRLDWFYEVNNLTTAVGLVEERLGASVLPRLATPTRHHPVIVTKAIRSPEVVRTIGIVERRTSRLPPAAQSFRDMVQTNCVLRSPSAA